MKYRLGYKIVIAGLREHSSGDGTNRRTVNHAVLTEDFESGKFKRKEGEIACGANHGSFDLCLDGDWFGKLTCKGCVAIVAKHATDSKDEKPL